MSIAAAVAAAHLVIPPDDLFLLVSDDTNGLTISEHDVVSAHHNHAPVARYVLQWWHEYCNHFREMLLTALVVANHGSRQ